MTLTDKAWQLIANAKIEQAIQEGKFNRLPGFGKPLDLGPVANAGDLWLKRKAKQENLELLPPALILKRLVERKKNAILEMDNATEAKAALVELNQFIEKGRMKILWGPPSDVQKLDTDAFMEVWQNSTRKNSEPTSSA